MTLVPSPSEADYLAALRAFLIAILPSSIEVVRAQGNRVSAPAGPDYVYINTIGRERLSLNVTTYADCSFVGSVSGSVLTVTAVKLGTILLDAHLLGEGVADGTSILSQTSGPAGGAGIYTLSQAQPAPISGVPLATGAALIEQPTKVTVQVDVYGPNAADNVQTVTTLFRDDYAALWFFRQGYAARGISVLYADDPRQMAFQDAEQEYEDRYTLDVALQVNQVVAPSQDFADSVTVVINTPVDALPD